MNVFDMRPRRPPFCSIWASACRTLPGLAHHVLHRPTTADDVEATSSSSGRVDHARCRSDALRSDRPASCSDEAGGRPRRAA